MLARGVLARCLSPSAYSPTLPLTHPHLDNSDGRLALAATRGDGTEGEDVTRNAAAGAIAGLPARLDVAALESFVRSSSAGSRKGGAAAAKAAAALPRELEVRGEVFMTKADLALVSPTAGAVV